MAELPHWRSTVIPISITLALGTVGGWIFDYLQTPLAWMIGAMCITTVAAISGAPMKSSRGLRNIVIPVLGIMLGSAFTPEALESAHKWVPSLLTMLLYITFVAACVGTFFYRVVGAGAITSYFSATPGGLATMVVLGGDKGGDERTIALTHSVRILLTVLIIPIWFRLFAGYQPGGLETLGTIDTLTLYDAGVLLLCGFVGVYGGKLLRLPSAQVLGPMLASVGFHLSGITDAKPPVEVVNIAQVVIGAGIGARFAGIDLKYVAKVLTAAVGSTLFMVGFAALISFGLEQATGLPFQSLLLSFAPGGLAEMALISIAMGIDPAFVSSHHLIRVAFMVSAAPLVFHLLERHYGVTDDHPRRE
jgi:membrane AbrB-like protein